jgi:predicted RNA-binding protein with PIN domain
LLKAYRLELSAYSLPLKASACLSLARGREFGSGLGVGESTKHLLVDGNNIGRAWGSTGKLWRKDANAARALIVDTVRVWHDVMGWRVSVIFDGRGSAVSLEHPTDEKTFAVAYSPTGMTADSLIEQWVAGSRDAADCVVATADRALKETLHALGAATIGSRELRAWLDRAETRVRRQL